MKKIPFATLIVAAGLFVLFAIYACSFQVRFSDVVVKVTLGKADESSVYDQPGWKFRWPWPIETITRYDRRLRTLDIPELEIKTRDEKNVIVGAYALWKITNPLQFYKSAPNELGAIEQIRARLNQVRAAAVGRREMIEFVNLNEAILNASYDALEAEMLSEAKAGIAKDYGVDLVRFELRRNSLPTEATQAVFEQMRKEREIKATGYAQAGKSAASTIEAKAKANADQIMSFAARRAQEIASAGVQASTHILARIEDQDREFFEWLRWLDAVKAALQQRSTIFLDSNSPMFRVLNEPAVLRSETIPDAASEREPNVDDE
ncbi:MAG: hypothetical protein JXO22_15070 [Phycisphaerae bacterium]|nr:hypothetical protein [Phycisphaerae bacterium]